MDKSERTLKITDFYLERYGKVLIGIYYLPSATENWIFMVFINSLMITLRRMDLVPHYTWFMDANAGHYFILWLNGYFRNDLSDITAVVNRLWMNHSASQLTVIDCFSVSIENHEYGVGRLRQFVYSAALNLPITTNWHQRTFGTSRLR